jgi:hypothetical protein
LSNVVVFHVFPFRALAPDTQLTEYRQQKSASEVGPSPCTLPAEWNVSHDSLCLSLSNVVVFRVFPFRALAPDTQLTEYRQQKSASEVGPPLVGRPPSGMFRMTRSAFRRLTLFFFFILSFRALASDTQLTEYRQQKSASEVGPSPCTLPAKWNVSHGSLCPSSLIIVLSYHIVFFPIISFRVQVSKSWLADCSSSHSGLDFTFLTVGQTECIGRD